MLMTMSTTKLITRTLTLLGIRATFHLKKLLFSLNRISLEEYLKTQLLMDRIISKQTMPLTKTFQQLRILFLPSLSVFSRIQFKLLTTIMFPSRQLLNSQTYLEVLKLTTKVLLSLDSKISQLN